MLARPKSQRNDHRRNDETRSVWGRVHRKALPPQFMEPRSQGIDKSPRHVFDVQDASFHVETSQS